MSRVTKLQKLYRKRNRDKRRRRAWLQRGFLRAMKLEPWQKQLLGRMQRGSQRVPVTMFALSARSPAISEAYSQVYGKSSLRSLVTRELVRRGVPVIEVKHDDGTPLKKGEPAQINYIFTTGDPHPFKAEPGRRYFIGDTDARAARRDRQRQGTRPDRYRR